MNDNKKSYNISIRTSQAYTFIISGFQFATSLFFRIRDHIVITFVPKFTTKMVTNINLRKIKLVISQMKLIANMTQTISLRTVKINYTMRDIMKFVTTIYIRNPITFISSGIQKITSTMNTGILGIDFNPTLANFFTLGDNDPDTLGTMDTETWGDLDYVPS